ncbi:hypothetical protein BRADI_1g49713v3 [Brachypodium distachyon]|uniref:Uncharacterized protein n=1 Tax=Brachypodium distachyon TaxID=15368 RepID=A0A0Q3JPJ2_BRADI|nr:hypothetical protein BRADI_1g49713v3 [Brachypodium distachyon]
MIATTICSQNGHHLHSSCSPFTLLNYLTPMGLMENSYTFCFSLALSPQHENKRKNISQANYCREWESIKVTPYQTFLVFLEKKYCDLRDCDLFVRNKTPRARAVLGRSNIDHRKTGELILSFQLPANYMQC